LEKRRDRGESRSPCSRTPSPLRYGAGRASDADIDLVPVVRLLTALEDSLGSLGPQINQILARALSIEQNRDGASRILLEDPDTVSVLDLVKEKLSGQLVAGLLSGSRAAAVRVALDHLTRLIQMATKKRSVYALSGMGGGGDAGGGGSQISSSNGPLGSEEAIKLFIAKSIATVLVTTDRAAITDAELEELVEETMRLMAGDAEGSRSSSDPASVAVGRVARGYSQAVELERKLVRQQEAAAQLAAASLPLLLSSARAAAAAAANPSQPLPTVKSSDDAARRRPVFEDDDDDDVEMPAAAASTAGPAYITPMYTGQGSAARPHQVPLPWIYIMLCQ